VLQAIGRVLRLLHLLPHRGRIADGRCKTTHCHTAARDRSRWREEESANRFGAKARHDVTSVDARVTKVAQVIFQEDVQLVLTVSWDREGIPLEDNIAGVD
jgi:hypothetical protein